MRVIVHGGAGGEPEEPDTRESVLEAAAAEGVAADTPLDAVERAVSVLEEHPLFNAGVGGARQSDGTVRVDAGLMNDERELGAVCSVEGVVHATSAARVVLEETPHTLVAGEQAADLAADFGVGTGRDLVTDRTRERWAALDPPEGGPTEQLRWLRGRQAGADTVGAVAVDTRGHAGPQVAAATSTGGRWLSLAGRVGDVPQAGSGFYATSAGGASATGVGEDIVRVLLARRAVAGLADGLSAQRAADRALAEFEDLTDSTAGLIVLGADGDAGAAFNSAAMGTAAARD